MATPDTWLAIVRIGSVAQAGATMVRVVRVRLLDALVAAAMLSTANMRYVLRCRMIFQVPDSKTNRIFSNLCKNSAALVLPLPRSRPDPAPMAVTTLTAVT